MDRANDRLFALEPRVGRWLFIPVGIAVLMCLGSVYSWSVFKKPLQAELQLTATQAMLPFTLALTFYAAAMPVAGFVIARIGPRLTTIIGGLVVAAGYLLASVATDITLIVLSYGVIAGAGVGIAYGAPLAVSARWFPDRKGLAVGMTVVGFGLSPVVSAPLASLLIDSLGVRAALRAFGLGMLVLVPALAMLLRLPRGPLPFAAGLPRAQADARDLPPTMLGSRAFYGLWVCFALGTMIGLSAIGISSPVGEELVHIPTQTAAFAVAIFALCNGLSRPLGGWLIDRFPPHRIAAGTYLVILVACGLMKTAGRGDVATYLAAFCLFWACLGGWLAIAPATTLRLFDPDRYTQNYGIVFTAYGVGAIVGTLLTGTIRDLTGSYGRAFDLMAFLAVLGIVASLTLLRPRPARDR